MSASFCILCTICKNFMFHLGSLAVLVHFLWFLQYFLRTCYFKKTIFPGDDTLTYGLLDPKIPLSLVFMKIVRVVFENLKIFRQMSIKIYKYMYKKFSHGHNTLVSILHAFSLFPDDILLTLFLSQKTSKRRDNELFCRILWSIRSIS